MKLIFVHDDGNNEDTVCGWDRMVLPPPPPVDSWYKLVSALGEEHDDATKKKPLQNHLIEILLSTKLTLILPSCRTSLPRFRNRTCSYLREFFTYQSAETPRGVLSFFQFDDAQDYISK